MNDKVSNVNDEVLNLNDEVQNVDGGVQNLNDEILNVNRDIDFQHLRESDSQPFVYIAKFWLSFSNRIDFSSQLNLRGELP